MATMRKRGSSWQVQVRRFGHTPISRSFPTKDEARRWATMMEHAVDGGRHIVQGGLTGVRQAADERTLGDLLDRYGREVTPTKRGADRELHKLRLIKRHSLCEGRAETLKPAAVAAYRDQRLTMVMPATVKRELAIIKHCFEVAIREWDLALQLNPVKRIKVAHSDPHRERRLTAQEFKRFNAALDESVWFLKPIVSLALETGMRRGEIFAIRRTDIIQDRCLLKITRTKNGHSRIIPLTQLAMKLLNQTNSKDLLFEVNPSTFQANWSRCVQKANIKDFRFHDIRHEAISRFFEMGLTVAEVSAISGHKTVSMLFRYLHLRPEDIGKKLARIAEEATQQLSD